MSDSIREIPKLIEKLRAADPAFRVFGSEQHRYQIGPRLTEDEVTRFESARGVILPDNYRQYLLNVGNGGAGPYYGLETLETASRSRNLAEPFPFISNTKTRTSNTETLTPEQLVEFVRLYEYSGILELCHQGCAIYSYLVVTGPTGGTMWDGREHYYPRNESFAAWYLRWAKGKLTILGNDSLIPQLKRGMTVTDVDRLGGTWHRREARGKIFYESADVVAQLEIDQKGIVRKINPWDFI